MPKPDTLPDSNNLNDRVRDGSPLSSSEQDAFNQIAAGFDTPPAAAPLTPRESAALDQIGAGIEASNSRARPRPSSVPSANRTYRLAGHRPAGTNRQAAADNAEAEPTNDTRPTNETESGFTPEGGTPNDSSHARPTTSHWQNDDTDDGSLYSRIKAKAKEAKEGYDEGMRRSEENEAKDQSFTRRAFDKIRSAEGEPKFHNVPKQEKNGNSLGQVVTFAVENRKALFSGGGVAGAIGILALLFMSLTPLKLNSIIQNFSANPSGRVQSYIERRVQKIVYRAIYEGITGETAYGDSEIFAMIIGNISKKDFEKRLWENKGIKMERVGRHGVRFISPNGTFNAEDFPRLARWLDTELVGRQADLAIRDFVRSEYKPWRIIKRHHLRKYLRNAYRIWRWYIPRKEENGNPRSNTPTDTEGAVRDSALGPPANDKINVVSCATDTDCNGDNARSENPEGELGLNAPDTPANPDSSEAAEQAKNKLREGFEQMKKMPADVIEKTITKILGEATAKALLKAVPVVGWVALAGDIDDAIWHGRIQHIGVALRESQYVAVAATWASLNDQLNAGRLASGQINVIMTMIEQIEKSAAFQKIVMGHDGGQGIPEDKQVNSDSTYVDNATRYAPCEYDYLLRRENAAGQPVPAGWDKFTFYYRSVMGIPSFHPSLCVVRGLMDRISAIIGFVTQPLANGFMAVVDRIPGVNGAFSTLMESAGDLLKWMVDHIWTPVYNGEWNAVLGNSIEAGFDVMFNNLCRDMFGGAMISLATAQEQNLQVAADNQAMLRQHGPLASLLDINYPQSLGSRLLALMPATPTAAANQFSGFATAAIAHPTSFFLSFGKFFSPGAGAAAWTSAAHVQQFGFQESTLADTNLHFATRDVNDSSNSGEPDGRIDQFDCTTPDGRTLAGDQATDPTKEDRCRLDTRAAQAICSATSTNDDGGLGGHGDPGPCGDVETEPANSGTDGDNGTGDGSTPGAPCTTVQQCAQMLLQSRARYWTNAIGINTRDVVVALSRDQAAYTTCANANGAHPAVNIKIMQFLVETANTTDLMVNAITDKCHSRGSNHYSGQAVDLDVGNSGPVGTIQRIATKYGGVKNNETSHHHFDFLR